MIARDYANATSSITVVISITNANDQPHFPAAEIGQRSVEENQANVNIGAPVEATDQDGDTLTYELTSGDTSSFTINSRTGQLTTAGALDSDAQSTYTVTVSVRDNKDAQGAPDTAEDASIQVTITVTDVNEPPVLTGDTSPEFAENGQGPVAAYDADDPENGNITWSLSGDDADDMDISGGDLYFNDPPDHEAQGTYNVIVQAFDGNSTGTLPVVVTVTDVNEQPEFPSTETGQRTVEENTASGQDIGAPVQADDPDDGDTLTYLLGGDDAYSFDIDSSTGQILTKDPLDEDTKAYYYVTVEVHDGKDDNGDPATTTDASMPVTITVIGVNEAPTLTGTTTTEYPENETRVVATYTATDPEGVSPIWGLSGTDADDFEISGGDLTFVSPPNFEDQRVHHVTVEAGDGNSTGTLAVVVTVTNVNEDPAFPDTEDGQRSVAENTVAGRDIGDPVAATDPDRGDTLTYVLSGNDAEFFDIDDSTGQLQTKSDLNTEDQATYIVYVDVHDGKDENGDTSTTSDAYKFVTITVEDVNEVPMVSGTSTTEYAENDTRTIATYSFDDPDGDNISWSAVATDGTVFSMTSGGVLSFVTPPDFEAKEEYSVTVAASDSKLTGTLEVTINITDVNEPPDVTGRTTITFVETATGPVETFKANDPEEDDTDITWAVLGTDTDDFTITDGALNFASTPDYENPTDSPPPGDNVYEITIKATDDNSQSDTLDVTVIVTDQNQVPEFPGETTSRDVSENVPPNQNVGTPVRASDPENDRLTYSLSGTDVGHFDISTSTGQILTKGELNHEGTKTYTVTVSVTDGTDPQGNDDTGVDNTIQVTINVIDENEAPEITGDSIKDWPENATGTVATYKATDPEGATTTWTVLGDASDFSISDDGVLSIDNAPNYEVKNFYQVKVRASDKQNIAELDVTVTITNIDEPGVVTLSPTSPVVGTQVDASLTDPDLVDTITGWSWHHSSDKNNWTLISGATGGAYTPGNDDEGKYLQATASYDDGHGAGKSASGTTDDKVPETNSQPSFSPSTTRSVDENTESGQPIGDPVTAKDDESDDLTYSLDGTDAAHFDIATSTGQLMTKDALNFEDKPSYSVTISVSDGKNVDNNADDTTDATIPVTVNVNNVNEPPVVTGNETPTFNENAAGTVATYTAEDPDVRFAP